MGIRCGIVCGPELGLGLVVWFFGKGGEMC